MAGEGERAELLCSLRGRLTHIEPSWVADALEQMTAPSEAFVFILAALVGSDARTLPALCDALRSHPTKINPVHLADVLAYAPMPLVRAFAPVARDSSLQRAVAALFPSLAATLSPTVVSILVERSTCNLPVLRGVNSYLRHLRGLANPDIRVSIVAFDSAAYDVYRWVPIADAFELTSLESPPNKRGVHTRLHEVPSVWRGSGHLGNGCALRDVLGNEIRAIRQLRRAEKVVPHSSVILYTQGIDTTSDRYSAAELERMVAAAIADGWRFLVAPSGKDSEQLAQKLGARYSVPGSIDRRTILDVSAG